MDSTDKKNKRVYCLILDNQILGIWTNLKKLALEMEATTVFVTYSKLSKDIMNLRREGIEEGKITFRTKDKKDYTIQIVILK